MAIIQIVCFFGDLGLAIPKLVPSLQSTVRSKWSKSSLVQEADTVVLLGREEQGVPVARPRSRVHLQLLRSFKELQICYYSLFILKIMYLKDIGFLGLFELTFTAHSGGSCIIQLPSYSHILRLLSGDLLL